MRYTIKLKLITKQTYTLTKLIRTTKDNNNN